MTPQQKISVLGLGVFAIAAITLGLLHINQGIIRPITFEAADDTLEVGKELSEDETYAELSSKDTDNDGLNDYEELHVFGTSPYLTDTDGDNIEDATEIQNGGDPNCPEGRTCGVVLDEPRTEESVVGSKGAGAFLNVKDPKEVTPDLLRKAFLEGGVASEDLDQMDDEMLMQLWYDFQSGGGLSF